jgi:hypothetical protein
VIPKVAGVVWKILGRFEVFGGRGIQALMSGGGKSSKRSSAAA